MTSPGYPALDGYLCRVGLRLYAMEGHRWRDILDELARHILHRTP